MALGDDADVLLIVGSILLTLVGYAFTWWSGKKDSETKAKAEFVGRQLSDLYGPLNAIVNGSACTFSTFCKRHEIDVMQLNKALEIGGDVPEDAPATKEVKIAREYRLLIKNVLQPLNLKVVQIIMEHADLFDGNMPPWIYEKLVGHVYENDLIIAKWDSGDFSQHLATTPYPHDLLTYLSEKMAKLRNKQKRLAFGKRVKRNQVQDATRELSRMHESLHIDARFDEWSEEDATTATTS